MEINNAFRIHPREGPAITLVCSSIEEKSLWMKDITNCIAGELSSLQESAGTTREEGIAEAFEGAGSSGNFPGSTFGGVTQLPSDDAPDGDKSKKKKKNRGPQLDPHTECWQGFVLKLEGSFMSMWKKRWVSVTKDGLMYLYKNKGDNTPLRTYALGRLTLTAVYRTGDHSFYYLSLNEQKADGGKREMKKPLQIGAFSKDAIQKWIYVLRPFISVSEGCAKTDHLKFDNLGTPQSAAMRRSPSAIQPPSPTAASDKTTAALPSMGYTMKSVDRAQLEEQSKRGSLQMVTDLLSGGAGGAASPGTGRQRTFTSGAVPPATVPSASAPQIQQQGMRKNFHGTTEQPAPGASAKTGGAAAAPRTGQLPPEDEVL